jgi:hypothetical protein
MYVCICVSIRLCVDTFKQYQVRTSLFLPVFFFLSFPLLSRNNTPNRMWLYAFQRVISMLIIILYCWSGDESGVQKTGSCSRPVITMERWRQYSCYSSINFFLLLNQFRQRWRLTYRPRSAWLSNYCVRVLLPRQFETLNCNLVLSRRRTLTPKTENEFEEKIQKRMTIIEIIMASCKCDGFEELRGLLNEGRRFRVQLSVFFFLTCSLNNGYYYSTTRKGSACQCYQTIRSGVI